MRAFLIALLLLLSLSVAVKGQGGKISSKVNTATVNIVQWRGKFPAEEKKATIGYIHWLRDKDSGAYKNEFPDKPSLRATYYAIKALRALGEKVTELEKIHKFLLARYDAKMGTFAEPDGKPDATSTCFGIILALEVGLPRKEIPKAIDSS